MLRRTSKRVKEVVDKMRLPAVVRLSRSFWDDDPPNEWRCVAGPVPGTERAKCQLVLRQITLMIGWCRISRLELPSCRMEGQDAERLAEVLAHSPTLAHLNISDNYFFGAAGTERLAGVLGQCRELVHLNLYGNQIRSVGQRALQECWRSSRWLTSMSAAIILSMLGQRALQECWRSAQR
jgi:hypothetical protein